MNLQPGSTLGNYEVIGLIGEGGMGSVYRANDSRLGRQVALKIVRPSLVASADHATRFTREARLLASLNHPNIATIHGIEESGGVRFLVLELVPGATLAEIVARGPLPVRDALILGAQIATAIEAAHERGIIHRDLKPANIKVTPDGTVKVLDFGLAKALAAESSSEGEDVKTTLAPSGTAAGVILGTAAYMSPEQARGAQVDKRCDVWALGCVLFDMLTGQTAFGAQTASDTIAAVLTRDPDWSRLPADLPASVRALLRRLLVKDLHRRLHDAGDARIELEDAVAALADPSAAPSGERRPATDRRRRVGTAAAAVVSVAVLAGAAGWMLKPSAAPPARRPVQFVLPLPPGEALDRLDFAAVAMSPDETHVVFVATRGGQSRLFVRALAESEARPIPGTEEALSPFFSPDGEWIAFFAAGQLKKVQVAGGPVQKICDAAIGFGGAWGADGTIVYAPDNGSAIWQVSADGGVGRPITRLDTARGEFSHRWPELVPDSGLLLYTVGTEGSWDDAAIVAQSLKSGERTTIIRGGTNPKYLPGGRLLFARGGSVLVAPFDPRRRLVTADASPILAGVVESSDGAIQLSVSRAGGVVYLAGESDRTRKTLVWVDRQGNVQPFAAPERAYSSPRLSPDGRMLAVAVAGPDRDEVWTYDIARSAPNQVTFEGGTAPVWTGDGRRIIFSASRGGPPALFWKPADGSGSDERLTTSQRADVPGSASLNGRTVALAESDLAGGGDILLLDTDDRTSRAFVKAPPNGKAPALSPGGQWVAYVSDESGRDEVYLAPAADPKRRLRVSADGGTEPAWSRDSAELFFRSGDRMLAAAVAVRPSLSVKPPTVLFSGAFDKGQAARAAYDVSGDARFLMVASPSRSRAPAGLHVILGWPAPWMAADGSARQR